MTASKYVTTRRVDTHVRAGMDTRWMVADLIARVGSSAQNIRGRWAIRPRELHNRPRQVAHGGDCKIKNRPRGIKIIVSDITLTQYWVSIFKP